MGGCGTGSETQTSCAEYNQERSHGCKSLSQECSDGVAEEGYNTTRFGVPSWKLLVAAVAHPAGGNNRALAEQIAKKYCGKCRICFIAVDTSPP